MSSPTATSRPTKRSGRHSTAFGHGRRSAADSYRGSLTVYFIYVILCSITRDRAWMMRRRPGKATKAGSTRNRPGRASSTRREEFAEHGFSGARMEAIAGRTKTVKQILYYYFGSKQSLCFACWKKPVPRSARRTAPRPTRFAAREGYSWPDQVDIRLSGSEPPLQPLG